MVTLSPGPKTSGAKKRSRARPAPFAVTVLMVFNEALRFVSRMACESREPTGTLENDTSLGVAATIGWSLGAGSAPLTPFAGAGTAASSKEPASKQVPENTRSNADLSKGIHFPGR